jgi:hypothetical protein
MKPLRHAGLLLFTVSSLLTLRAADDASLKVQASRSLALAVVDLDRKNAASDQVSEAFKESLSFEMSQRCKMPTPIKPIKLDASRAGWGLGTGVYDVAVVIGGAVPKTMVSSAFTVIKAVSLSGDPKKVVSLITRNDDPGLAQLLSESFPEAIKGPFFLKALMRYSGAPEADETGLKVASLGN